MARKIFTLGIFVMAVACGVIGHQALTYYFYGRWPSVSFEYIYAAVFGPLPALQWHWANNMLMGIGKLPVAVVGFALSYLLLFVSDLLRGQANRQAS